MTVADRALLAFTALVLVDERRRERYGDDFDLTDSCVLDVIDAWTTGPCPESRACDSDTCCDYQRLGALVWGLVEGAHGVR